MNKENYYIGGWTAANYWGVTEQIPANVEIYTNKRNGSLEVLGTKFIFRKTTQKRIDSSVIKKTNKHKFRILNKKDLESYNVVINNWKFLCFHDFNQSIY